MSPHARHSPMFYIQIHPHPHPPTNTHNTHIVIHQLIQQREGFVEGMRLVVGHGEKCSIWIQCDSRGECVCSGFFYYYYVFCWHVFCTILHTPFICIDFHVLAVVGVCLYVFHRLMVFGCQLTGIARDWIPAQSPNAAIPYPSWSHHHATQHQLNSHLNMWASHTNISTNYYAHIYMYNHAYIYVYI